MGRMVWNYRIVRRIEKRETCPDEVMLYVHEAYYPKRGAKPDSITKDPIVIFGEDNDSIRWVLGQIEKALEQPVLNYEDFVKDEDDEEVGHAPVSPVASNHLKE